MYIEIKLYKYFVNVIENLLMWNWFGVCYKILKLRINCKVFWSFFCIKIVWSVGFYVDLIIVGIDLYWCGK